MGLTHTKVLAFVIDTTGSMSDYMAEIKKVSINITNSRKGTTDEPTEYILITFNNTGKLNTESKGGFNHNFVIFVKFEFELEFVNCK